jgi:hypothetical protein
VRTKIKLKIMSTKLDYSKKMKKELLKEHKKDLLKVNFPNKFFKIEYLKLGSRTIEDLSDGTFINGEYYINGKIYSKNNLWCDNDNEVVECCWYNIKNLTVEEMTNEFIDSGLYHHFMVESECLSIKMFGLDEYYQLMKNKIVLTDVKNSFNSFPQLNKEIEKFGYDKVMETLKSLEWIKKEGLEEFILN